MLTLNLNLQFKATSALWANDSTMENITQAYSKIWIIKYKKGKERKKVGAGCSFFGRGRPLRACCWRRRWAPRVWDELACDTHPLQCRGFQLDMQEKSATEVCAFIPRSVSFFGKRGVRLGLIVEGEDERLGLALMMICLQLHTLFSIGVSS
jgi:hypothetical protein